jgi:uncharacterized RmlC-like cupin family protein
VLVNNHDPKHLHDEFDTDYPGGYQWTYLERGPQVWRILIGKRASTALPQILVNTAATAGPDGADVTGAVWKLPIAERDLDSNIVALAPGGGIDAHTGPDLDVLIHVLSGSGRLTTELDVHVALKPGDLVQRRGPGAALSHRAPAAQGAGTATARAPRNPGDVLTVDDPLGHGNSLERASCPPPAHVHLVAADPFRGARPRAALPTHGRADAHATRH